MRWLLPGTEPDAEAVAQAVGAIAAELRLPGKAVEIAGGTPRRRVLDLHAAALVAVLDQGGIGPVRIDIGGVQSEP